MSQGLHVTRRRLEQVMPTIGLRGVTKTFPACDEPFTPLSGLDRGVPCHWYALFPRRAARGDVEPGREAGAVPGPGGARR
ncbi:MAG TPA: hypothetical protein VFV66_37830 [Nonomuraea sp.]|nr:hypothetical protein [Nonomuraea sp.]